MTTYNTGNPIGSSAAKDLYDNAENLDVAINSATTLSWRDRLGVLRPTVAGAIARMVSSQFLTQSSLVASGAPPLGQVWATVVNDTDALNGYYYWGGTSWAKSSLQPASAADVSRLDSIRVNAGKDYPLKAVSRAGVISPASVYPQAFLLDVKVIGPALKMAGKFYKIGYFQNGATIGGDSDNGISLEEADASTYASTGTLVNIHSYNDAPADYNLAKGGIQTFTVVPKNRTDLAFVITVDCDAMPPAGTYVALNNINVPNGYSWIIDPSCYFPVVTKDATVTDALTINSGRVLPFTKAFPRDGAVSADSSGMLNVVLDCAIFGAAEGKLYRIGYMNTAPKTGDELTVGIIIEEYEEATYSTAAVAVRLLNYTTPAGTIRMGGGVQTLVVPIAARPGLKFRITLDASKITSSTGNWIVSVNPGAPGLSWVIDKSRYFPGASGSSGATSATGVYYEWEYVAKVVRYAYRSGAYFYKVGVGVNGYNGLPNIIDIYRAPATADITAAAWTLLSTTSTDYFPPLIFKADAGGDGASAIYTGGNHGADGDAGGGQTARNVLFLVYADGQLLPTTSNASGFAEVVSAQIINEIAAYNTITFPRYPLRQSFNAAMSGAGIDLSCRVTAREAITVTIDNGPQAAFSGFATTQLMLGGQNTARVPTDTSLSSGNKVDYPGAWCLLNTSGNGTMATWVDRTYGAGDGSYVGAAAPYIRGPGAGRGKFYHAIVASASAVLAAGASYEWRGGFHFFDSPPQTAAVDTAVALQIGGVTRLVTAYPDGKYEIN